MAGCCSVVNLDDDNFKLIIPMSGFNKEDVKIDIEGFIVTLEAVKKVCGTGYKNFKRYKQTFTLPDNIDEECITTNFNNCELLIEAPYKEC